MKVSGSMDEEMVRVSKFGQMVQAMRVNGREVDLTEKERTHTQMATLTQVIGSKIRNMEKVRLSILAELSTQVTG